MSTESSVTEGDTEFPRNPFSFFNNIDVFRWRSGMDFPIEEAGHRFVTAITDEFPGSNVSSFHIVPLRYSIERSTGDLVLVEALIEVFVNSPAAGLNKN